MHPYASIELLEARIAPAAVFVSATTATYDDVDGDHVTVKFSKPILTAANVGAVVQVTGGQLKLIDLDSLAGPTQGTSITISAKLAGNGDGLVNVGEINAIGVDLGTVSIHGDLGKILAGDATTATAGLKSLAVQSLGRYGTGTGAPDLESDITGALGALVVKSDVFGTFVNVTGGGDGKIGSVTIGGSLLGGPNSNAGEIESAGAMGAVKIGGDVEGGSGMGSGLIDSAGKLASVTIGGSLVGGSNSSAGEISGFEIGALKIGGDLQGGGGSSSGYVFSNGQISSVSIGGSVRGGSAMQTGEIYSNTGMGSVSIGGSLLGGITSQSGEIFTFGSIGAVKVGGSVQGNYQFSGYLHAEKKITSVTVGGSLAGGLEFNSGEIDSVGDMGPVKIGGDVQGGSDMQSGYLFTQGKLASVSVGGSLVGGTNTDTGEIASDGDMGVVKIGVDVRGGSGQESGIVHAGGKLASVSVGGSLLGGGNTSTGEIQSHGDLGSVTIGRDIVGGSVGNGSRDATGLILGEGRIGSVLVGGSILAGIDGAGGLTRSGAIIAGDDIGTVIVKGSLLGTSGSGGTTFAEIVAAGPATEGTSSDLAIGKISIGGRVQQAEILAGYNLVSHGGPSGAAAVNGDAQIGAVSVGGDWVASNLVAGAMNSASSNANFGDANDALIGVGASNILSKIASITISGQVLGTGGGSDHFGFVAQQIGSFKTGGTSIPLTAGAHLDERPLAVATTNDVTIHEI